MVYEYDRPHRVPFESLAGAIDFVTLTAILAGSVVIGLRGAVEFDALNYAFGQYDWIAQIFLGVSGLWQLMRQRGYCGEHIVGRIVSFIRAI